MLVSNIDWSDYVGRIAVGKILGGRPPRRHGLCHPPLDGSKTRAKITKVIEFTGLGTAEAQSGTAGNIVGLSGFEDIDIGDTIAASEDQHACPSPRSTRRPSRCSSASTTAARGPRGQARHLAPAEGPPLPGIEDQRLHQGRGHRLGRRLQREGRGAMQIAVLVETMRREGFELLVSRPTVIERSRTASAWSPTRPSGSRCPTNASGRSSRTWPTARA